MTKLWGRVYIWERGEQPVREGVGLLIPKLRLDDVEEPGQPEADFEEEMKADPRGSENEAADVDAGVRMERIAPA